MVSNPVPAGLEPNPDVDSIPDADLPDEEPVPDAIAAETRRPIPDRSALHAADEAIHEEFEAQLQSSHLDVRRNAASDLLREALATADPAFEYRLLELAIESAASAGDVETARRALSRLIERFEIPANSTNERTVNMFQRLSRTVQGRHQNRILLKALHDASQQLLDLDAYQEALTLANLSLTVSRATGDPELVSSTEARRRDVSAQNREYQGLRTAERRLKNVPGDPAANQSVGEFYCFIRQDWERGLPHLAKSSDPQLESLALSDLEHPETADQRVALADDWWSWSRSLRGPGREATMLRARHWYELAAPQLIGSARTRAEDRIAEVVESETQKYRDRPAVVDVAFRSAYELNRLYYVTGVPEELTHSRVFYHRLPGHPSGIEGGVVLFRVQRSGNVYLAASWEQDGINGPWQLDVTSSPQLQRNGWMLVGTIGLSQSIHQVYVRFCVAGEEFRIRTRKYGAPYVLLRDTPD